MSIIIFDTETTGLNPGYICQLAYVKIVENRVEGHNHYFKVDYIEPAAQNVHHLTVEMLEELSNGYSFESLCDKILRDFNGSQMVIAHNYAFDSAFLRAEAKRNGGVYDAKGFCTMNRFRDICKIESRNGRYKKPKLDELLSFLNINEDDIITFTLKVFGTKGYGKHDARVDAAALALVVMRAAKMDLCGFGKYPQIRALECI